MHVKFNLGREQKWTYWEGIPSLTDVGHAEVVELLGDTINDGKIC
jgi:hypothetical protein